MPTEIQLIFAELGIAEQLPLVRSLVYWPEADNLVIAEVAASGRHFELTPSTAKAWKLLKQAAQAEGVELQIVSAFRSIAYQATIIRRKLEQGQDLASILKLLAPPGYSEHHSGCAIDIGCPEYPRLDAQSLFGQETKR
jgi:D-alanyl-D-alanine carboxypeptidase